MTNKYIHSVLPSKKPVVYPSPLFANKEELQKELRSSGLSITLNDTLKGGFFAQVYGATLYGKSVVVKHVGSLTPFDPTEFYIPDGQFDTDVKVLRLLQKSSTVRVPHVIFSFPKIRTVIMEDMRQSGFTLLNDQIIAKELSLSSAAKVGDTFAHLIQESRPWKRFKTNESSEQSIYERGLELRLLYPNSQSQYLSLEHEYTSKDTQFSWPDGHPKNVFVNAEGDVAFIDFGRSGWADIRYMLPNFLAHIIIYCITGFIRKDLAKQYISTAIKTYSTREKFSESIFCQYLAMEVVHRAAGKWVVGVNTKEDKLALYRFGLTVFDEKHERVEQLLSIL